MKVCVKIWTFWPLYMFLGRLEGISRFKTRFPTIWIFSVQVTGRKAPSLRAVTQYSFSLSCSHCFGHNFVVITPIDAIQVPLESLFRALQLGPITCCMFSFQFLLKSSEKRRFPEMSTKTRY